MSKSNKIWLDVEIRHLTASAVLVHNGDREAWIPLSQVLDHEDELEVGAEIKIEISEWIALAKDLI
jgi:hypothetical protein